MAEVCWTVEQPSTGWTSHLLELTGLAFSLLQNPYPSTAAADTSKRGRRAQILLCLKILIPARLQQVPQSVGGARGGRQGEGEAAARFAAGAAPARAPDLLRRACALLGAPAWQHGPCAHVRMPLRLRVFQGLSA